MKIAVLGGKGCCSWATAPYLSQKGHEVAIIDSFFRRQWNFDLGAQTLGPIQPLPDHLRAWHEHTGRTGTVICPAESGASKGHIQ